MPVGPQRGQKKRQGWRGTGVWQVTQPNLGKLTGVHTAGMEGHTGIEMGTWHGGGGHSAEVRHHYLESTGLGRRPELEETTYTAGPFKTNYRAQIAAEGLARRVESGRGEEYRS
jgi:hypothetical protein